MVGASRGRRSIVLGAVILLALGASERVAASSDWTALRVLNIAHQGGENEAPSNTMYSYRRALRLGADMLEIDIHTSSDGELVVLHDATVDRTTDGSGRVYDMSLAEIQALDAAHNLVPGEGTENGRPVSDYVYRGIRTGERKPPPGFRPRDFRIPSLGEVMDAYPEVPINIEIKGAADSDAASFQRNAEILAAYLNANGRTEGIVVASFNDAALQRFHELAPQIDLAPGVAGVAGYKLGGVEPQEGTRVFQVPIEFNGITVTDEAFVDQAHADGYGVHVWTINDEDEMRTLLDWGVDGIMTAEPIRLERELCRAAVSRPPRPGSAPGAHCSPRGSIACDVRAVRAKRRGRRAVITLRRGDEFAGRCAGRAVLRSPLAEGRRGSRFGFGKLAPGEGGRQRRKVSIELPRRVRAAGEGARLRVAVHPYDAFVDRARLRLR